jgi:polyketide synthase 12
MSDTRKARGGAGPVGPDGASVDGYDSAPAGPAGPQDGGTDRYTDPVQDGGPAPDAALVRDDAVAVVGIACRLPQARSPLEFWDLLREGRSGVTDVPGDRWRDGGDPGVHRGGFLDRVDAFDAGFFGIAPREAAAMDPQQRLMLELGWEALEDAGHPPAGLRGGDLGVFVGAMADDYALLRGKRGPDAVGKHTLTGLQRSIIANRISYFLGAQGPSLAVDTGQSSSLVAVHLAARACAPGSPARRWPAE